MTESRGGSTTTPSVGTLLRPGMVVGGKFVLIRQIGEGGAGAVFEAEDTWIGRRVALKVLHPHYAKQPEVIWRFRREAMAAASIEHPNIVSVHEVGQQQDGSYFLVQQLLKGQSLRDHLKAQGRLRHQEVFDIMVPIMGALVSAHRKDIIHRDVKPENIFLAQAEAADIVPKLIDFGIARMKTQTDDHLTHVGGFVGTIAYMAPEQARDEVVDARTDVWAVGSVMFEMLSGSCPFDAATPALILVKILSETPRRITDILTDLPSGLPEVIHQALERDPERRFPTMEAFLHAILTVARKEVPDFSTRHASSIPRYVDTTPPPPAPEALDLADIVIEEVPPSMQRLSLPVTRPDLELHEDLPLPSSPDLVRYADHALSINALDDAVAYAEQAIVTRHATGELFGRMRLVQAIAYRWLGHYGEAQRCAIEASEHLARASSGWYSAVGHLAMVSGYLGNNDRLLELAEEIAQIQQHGRVTAGHIMTASRLAIALMRAGAPGIAERVFKSNRAISDTLPQCEPVVGAWVDVANAEFALHAGDPTTYLRSLESAVSGFAEAGDARNACLQRANIGNAYMQLGAYTRALDVLGEAISVGQPMRLNFIAPVRANLGFALARLGRLDQALIVEMEALNQCIQQGYRRFEAVARIYLTEILTLKDQLSEAEAIAVQAIESSSSLPPLRAVALANMSAILLKQDKAEQALQHAQEASHVLESLEGVEEGESLIRLVHILSLKDTGQVEQAQALLAKAQKRLHQRASRIHDPLWRRSFLENVPENAKTLALTLE